MIQGKIVNAAEPNIVFVAYRHPYNQTITAGEAAKEAAASSGLR